MTRCDKYLIIGIGLLKPFIKKGVKPNVSKRICLILSNGVDVKLIPTSRLKKVLDYETGEEFEVEICKFSKRSNYFKCMRALTGIKDLVRLKQVSPSVLNYLSGRIGIRIDESGKLILVKCPEGKIKIKKELTEEVLNSFLEIKLLEGIKCITY